MNKAGGVFDLDRLDWISSQHIKNMDGEKLYKYALPFLKEKEFFKNAPEERKTEKFVKKLLAVEKDRLEKFTQVGEENQFFFSENVKVEKDDMRWKDMQDEEIEKSLKRSLNVLENIEEENWTLDNITELLLKEAGDNRGELLFPLRAAITGEKRSPSPFEVAWVLGKSESLQRIEKAIDIF